MTKPTQRLPDWMVRLDQAVRAVWSVPFAWGKNDCCTVAADVVNAVTGVDPMQDLRGSYDSMLGALEKIRDLGGMPAILDARLGPQVAPALAQIGDIGLCDDGRLVFCVGAHWCGPGGRGIVTTSQPLKVWRCHE